MNPPFVGRHWRKHLDHARKFLRDRQKRPQSASFPPRLGTDGHLTAQDGRWSDLPIASFAESGTNVPTGILTTWEPHDLPFPAPYRPSDRLPRP